jgi:F0F1-type ATP synthase assembly protein I
VTGAERAMQTGMLTLLERMRFAAYGLAVGLIVGLFLGWMFHGFVGVVVRLLIVAIILAPFVVAIVFWLRVSNKNRAERGGIQDAEWRDLNQR